MAAGHLQFLGQTAFCARGHFENLFRSDVVGESITSPPWKKKGTGNTYIRHGPFPGKNKQTPANTISYVCLERQGPRMVTPSPTPLERQPVKIKLRLCEGVASPPLFFIKASNEKTSRCGHTQDRRSKYLLVPSKTTQNGDLNKSPSASTQSITRPQRDTSRVIPGTRRPIGPAPSRSPWRV